MKDINKNAPVHLVETIVINATPQQVWEVMTDVNNWPNWQKNITSAVSETSLAVGNVFNMTNSGDDIKGTFNSVQPFKNFGWESHYEGLDVAHNWTLTALEKQTLVRDEEGMEGPYAEANKAGIQTSIEKSKPEWLAFLKKEVERVNAVNKWLMW